MWYFKVVDNSTGKLLGPGERGELWIKGPQIMKGYLNKPEATRKTKDADGFLHTGEKCCDGNVNGDVIKIVSM